MRATVPILAMMIVCGLGVRARAADADDPEWPCFLLREGPRFTASLEHDLDTSRQRLLTRILGDLEHDGASCPAVTAALATFRHDLTSLFDATISKPRVLDRLRPRWTRRWNAAQCAEIETVAKSAAESWLSSEDGGSPSLPDLLARWSQRAESTPALRDRGMAQRIRDTLIDIRTELEAVQRDANATLARELPALIQRDKLVTLTAIDTCIRAQGGDADAGGDATVLSIEPPAPFVVARQPADGRTVMNLTSATGRPAAVPEDGSLCQLMFADDPEDAGRSQSQLNERAGDQAWRQSFLDRLRAGMDVDRDESFDLLGIRGIEVLGVKRVAAREAKAGIYLALLDTPRGRTVLTCATPADGFAEALAAFRSIREAIRPPR